MKNIISWLSAVSVLVFVPLIVVVMVIWGVLTSSLLIDLWVLTPSEEWSVFVASPFEIIFLAPAIETFLFQSLPYGLLYLSYNLKRRKWIVFTLSTVLFSLSHFYSVGYILYTLVFGYLMIYCYHLRRKYMPFLTIFTIHALVNAIFTVLNIFIDK